MPERYDPDFSQPNDDGLDEYLCEYVDGTMDAAVRRAFEEYLAQDPELRLHIERLRSARNLLCSSRRCTSAPKGLQHRLRMEIARDLMGDHGPSVYLPRVGHFAALTSLVGLAVLLGMVVGSALVQRPLLGDTGAADLRAEQSPVPSDAHGYPSSSAVRPFTTAGFGLAWPATALPVLTASSALTPIAGMDSLAAAGALRRRGAAP